MKKTLLPFIYILAVITFNKCTSPTSAIKGYTKHSAHFYFKLLALGDGNDKPAINDVINCEVVFKTLSDSVFFDTKHDAQNGLYIPLYLNNTQASINPFLLTLVEGDSASVYMNATYLFRTFFDTIVPNFCKKDTLLKMDFKVNQIIAKAQYLELKKLSKSGCHEDKELQELKTIELYLNYLGLPTAPDCYGIYSINKISTSLQPIKIGDKIKIEYEGFYLDEKPISAGKQQLEFIYGTPDQLIKGLNSVIGTLKNGETTKIIVPSRLAFGELGSSNGAIKPYTPLVYKLKIIDIK